MNRLLLPACIIAATAAAADTITIDGVRYDDVYVSDTRTHYYVCFPNTGERFSIPKSDVPESDVVLTSNPDVRDQLYLQWKEARDQVSEVQAAAEAQTTNEDHERGSHTPASSTIESEEEIPLSVVAEPAESGDGQGLLELEASSSIQATPGQLRTMNKPATANPWESLPFWLQALITAGSMFVIFLAFVAVENIQQKRAVKRLARHRAEAEAKIRQEARDMGLSDSEVDRMFAEASASVSTYAPSARSESRG